jgi:hypothetical protein
LVVVIREEIDTVVPQDWELYIDILTRGAVVGVTIRVDPIVFITLV